MNLGTGKEQKITITSSSNLSEAEIEKKIKEAEQFAEEDKKRREKVEVRNQADSLIYQTEKTLKELEGKVNPDDEAKVKNEVDRLKKVLESDNVEDMKKAIEDLTNAFHAISQQMYQQAQGQGAEGNTAGAGQGPTGKENVVDAEYEVVDDEDK